MRLLHSPFKFILALSLVSSCTTIHVWDGGFPDKGDDPSKFAIKKITHEFVEIGETKYSRASFEPIFRHATPSALPYLQSGDETTQERNDFVTPAFIGAATYALPPGAPAYMTTTRDVAMIGLLGLGYYYDKLSITQYEYARRYYQAELDKHFAGAK